MSEENKMIAGAIAFGPARDPSCKTTSEFLKVIREFERSIAPASNPPDKLDEIFRRQRVLMTELVAADKIPEFPIDITSKHGQRQIRELTWAMVEEMAEAVILLKNHIHHQQDRPEVDVGHFKEELGDALAYFVEICHFSGIGPDDLYDEYCAKNQVVRDRVRTGY